MRIHLLAVLGVGLLGIVPFATSAKADWLAPSPSNPTSSPDEPTFGDETTGDSEISGEIAIDLRDDATDRDVSDLDAKLGIVMHPSSAWSTTHDRLEVADVDPAAEAGLIDALSHDPRVE